MRVDYYGVTLIYRCRAVQDFCAIECFAIIFIIFFFPHKYRRLSLNYYITLYYIHNALKYTIIIQNERLKHEWSAGMSV